MVLPVISFVLGLASAFATALATSAGSAAGQRLVEAVWPKFDAAGAGPLIAAGAPSSAPQQIQAQRILVDGLESDPGFRNSVHTTLQANVPGAEAEIQRAATIFERQPALIERALQGTINLFDNSWQRQSARELFGFSEAHALFLHPTSGWTHFCPVGGEELAFLAGVSYRDGAGREAHPYTFDEYMTDQGQIIKKASVRAICANGHEWAVFA